MRQVEKSIKEIDYNGEKIQYILKRDKIKNLYIHIKNGKVLVKSPLRLKEEKITEFIEKKKKWIFIKLKENQENIEKESNENISKEDIENLVILVEKYIKKYSTILKVTPEKVRIKPLNYAWGSCSSNKNISINSKLANKNEKAVEYVVLHEMCHLIYMNHSKNFWNLVEKNMPNYKESKKLLA